jgi:hypothetical protein
MPSTPTTSNARVHTGQCSSRPNSSGTSTAATLTAIHATPAVSRCTFAALALGCGIQRQPSSAAVNPTGTLIRKAERQPNPAMSALVSAPPTSSPAAPPVPITRPKIDSARSRSAPAKSACTLASTCGTIIAADRPCAKRHAISAAALPASPQPAEVAVKAMRPNRNTRLRPNRSPRRPPVMSRIA